jgi:hypothetical protein
MFYYYYYFKIRPLLFFLSIPESLSLSSFFLSSNSVISCFFSLVLFVLILVILKTEQNFIVIYSPLFLYPYQSLTCNKLLFFLKKNPCTQHCVFFSNTYYIVNVYVFFVSFCVYFSTH